MIAVGYIIIDRRNGYIYPRFYKKRGIARSALTKMFGDYMRFYHIENKRERLDAMFEHAQTMAQIVPVGITNETESE